MKVQMNPNQDKFNGNVFMNKKHMTVGDIKQIEEQGWKLLDYASSQNPDYLISKQNHNKMEITAKLKNNTLKSDVFNYSVDKQENNIESILGTMKKLTKEIKYVIQN